MFQREHQPFCGEGSLASVLKGSQGGHHLHFGFRVALFAVLKGSQRETTPFCSLWSERGHHPQCWGPARPQVRCPVDGARLRRPHEGLRRTPWIPAVSVSSASPGLGR